MNCVRVCRSCFHQEQGPVELCTEAYASKLYGVPMDDGGLARISLGKQGVVGLQPADAPCNLVIRRAAQERGRFLARHRDAGQHRTRWVPDASATRAEPWRGLCASPRDDSEENRCIGHAMRCIGHAMRCIGRRSIHIHQFRPGQKIKKIKN